MQKINVYQFVGLIFMGIYFFTHHNGMLPDFIEGFCLGIGFVLILFGVYINKCGTARIRIFKINFLKKCFGKSDKK